MSSKRKKGEEDGRSEDNLWKEQTWKKWGQNFTFPYPEFRTTANSDQQKNKSETVNLNEDTSGGEIRNSPVSRK